MTYWRHFFASLSGDIDWPPGPRTHHFLTDVGMPTMLKVTKAVFPVAGLGTRFLPATKASPKEMLPIVDKPLIQYAVEEAIAAGITEMIFVTGRSKRAIEDHFDKSYEIEAELEARGKQKLLELVRSIKPANVDCFYVRQAEALGLGHAVLCAEKLVGDNPFAVILADDLLHSTKPVMTQIVEVFNHYHSSVIGVEEIAREDSQLVRRDRRQASGKTMSSSCRASSRSRQPDAGAVESRRGRAAMC